MAGSPELHKGLNQRHLTMIAMGGVIGAGLFVGSGAVINDAGPAAFLSYALCGVLIVLVMRMLGEMAVATPSTGSFADYARRALGGWAGFSVVWLNKSLDFSNLWAHGGFFPNGVGAVFSGIVVVIFSMVGAEIATIAAAESKDPARAIARATNSVIVRIAIFFVGSVFLLAVILPWNSTELGESPYVSAFKVMGLPYVDHLMNAVVLTAVLSCLNSGMYTASRMLFVLAARREAPVALITVNRRGVPVWAILFSTVVGFLCVIAAAIAPDTVFLFLLNSSGAIILFVYLLIAVSQL